MISVDADTDWRTLLETSAGGAAYIRRDLIIAVAVVVLHPHARPTRGNTTTAGAGVRSVGDPTAGGHAATVQPGVKDDRLRGLRVAGRVRRPVLR